MQPNEAATRKDDPPAAGVGVLAEFADIDEKDLQRVAIREHYGYVDAFREPATALLNSVGGIEYNGHPLPLEVATVFEHRPPRSHRRDRSSSKRDN